MKRKITSKRKFLLSILLLCIIGLGIGYSYLSQQLQIKNTVNYGSMKWDVHFDYVEDCDDINDELQFKIDYFDATVVKTNSTLSDDGKSIFFTFDFGNTTKAKFVIVKTSITNDSSFDVVYNGFSAEAEEEDVSLLNKYLNSTGLYWLNSDNSEFDFSDNAIDIGDVIKAGETKELLITGLLNELYEYDLPQEDITLDFTFNLEWIEASGYVDPE